MKSKNIMYYLCALFFLCLLSTKLTAQCCKVPDSLKVISVTDSSFCLQWRTGSSDTAHCDTAKSFKLRFRQVGGNWKYITRSYKGLATFNFCDSATACIQYQWQVANLCIKNGDSTLSTYAIGPAFTTKCDTGHFAKNNSTPILQRMHQVQITPNPAHDKIVVTGKYSGAVQVSVSSMTGKQMIHVELNAFNNALMIPMSISALQKGVYFLSITDKTGTLKQTFIKQ